MKIGIVGCGMVGSSVAFALVMNVVGREIIWQLYSPALEGLCRIALSAPGRCSTLRVSGPCSDVDLEWIRDKPFIRFPRDRLRLDSLRDVRFGGLDPIRTGGLRSRDGEQR